jgi:hypothetical protein
MMNGAVALAKCENIESAVEPLSTFASSHLCESIVDDVRCSNLISRLLFQFPIISTFDPVLRFWQKLF